MDHTFNTNSFNPHNNILCDVDGCILQAIERLFELLYSNYAFSKMPMISDIKPGNIIKQFPVWENPIREIFGSKEYWQNLPIYEDGVKAITDLHSCLIQHAYPSKIKFLTSPWLDSITGWAEIRYQTLSKLFPWITIHDLHITWDKPSVMGFCLIEDTPENLAHWTLVDAKNRSGYIVHRPHTAKYAEAKSWQNIIDILRIRLALRFEI